MDNCDKKIVEHLIGEHIALEMAWMNYLCNKSPTE